MDSRSKLERNLIDAGFSEESIALFFKYYDEGMTGELYRLLYTKREQLIAEIHEENERLNSLDYLIFRLKSNKGDL